MLIAQAHALAVIAGIGLTGLGVLFSAFFIKFALAVNRSDHPHRTEVTPEEQPRLYEFVKQLAEDTGTPVPRQIFLVPEVNTSVFYHSGFRNLFWPVRKNLDIGLGAVNSLSVSEFKAALAHEMGHFSPHGTKLGRYLYPANRILYKLAYADDPWDQRIDEGVAKGGTLRLFATALRGMVTGVRSILRWAYGIVNRQYAGVSADMEYHADLVATRVAGHDAMIAALRRLELGARAYDQCTDYLNQLAELGKKTEDIYADHRTVLRQLAKQYDLPLAHGLPQLPEGKLTQPWVTSRVNIRDQWASHLSRAEREQNIRTQPVAAEAYPQSAWKLLKNPTMVCRDVTFGWYGADASDQSFQSLSSADFADYVREEEQYGVSPAYHGFYDGRFLQRFDPEEVVAAQGESDSLTFEMIYTEAHYRSIARVFTNQDDADTLMGIQAGAITVGCFEFDHQKCSVKKTGYLVRLLNGDLARQKQWLTKLDQQAFLCHYQRARQAGVATEYVARYRTLVSLQEAYRSFSANRYQLAHWQQQRSVLAPRTNQELDGLTEELSSVEVSFKSNLLACVAVDHIRGQLTTARQQELVPYLRGEQAYYLKLSEFDEEVLDHFTDLVFDVWMATRRAYRQSLKSLTDYQLGLRMVEETQDVAQLQG